MEHSVNSQKENWTEDDLKEAVRRIAAGEITINDVEGMYGIPPRAVYRQRAKENIRAQLNPDKPQKSDVPSTHDTEKIDRAIVSQPVGISCSDLSGALKILLSGTDEVKRLLKHECTIIYECKVCRALFRSFVNFISHKRHNCELYSNTFQDDADYDDQWKAIETPSADDQLQARQVIREQINKPNRVTCKTDLTVVLQKMMELPSLNTEPYLKLQSINANHSAFYQSLITDIQNKEQKEEPPKEHTETAPELKPTEVEQQQTVPINADQSVETTTEHFYAPIEAVNIPQTNDDAEDTKGFSTDDVAHDPVSCDFSYIPVVRFRCPCCTVCLTAKKSVVRHLNLVHKKTTDQIVKLRPKIQVQVSRIKISSGGADARKQREELRPQSGKEFIRPVCHLCGKTFSYKRSLKVHLKRNCPKKKQSAPKIEGVPCKEIQQPNEEQSLAPSTTFPLFTNAAQPLKKIGIQVRINYRKDVQPNGSNSSSNGANGYSDIDIRDTGSTDDTVTSNNGTEGIKEVVEQTEIKSEANSIQNRRKISYNSTCDVPHSPEKRPKPKTSPDKVVQVSGITTRARSSLERDKNVSPKIEVPRAAEQKSKLKNATQYKTTTVSQRDCRVVLKRCKEISKSSDLKTAENNRNLASVINNDKEGSFISQTPGTPSSVYLDVHLVNGTASPGHGLEDPLLQKQPMSLAFNPLTAISHNTELHST